MEIPGVIAAALCAVTSWHFPPGRSGPLGSRGRPHKAAARQPNPSPPPLLAIGFARAGGQTRARHAIVASLYHRDNRGNLLALDIFTAAPDRAETLARGAGARWIFPCLANDGYVQAFIDRGSEGLAVRLTQDRIPSWLKPAPLTGTPYVAFELTPP